jgi:hypothetical protein
MASKRTLERRLAAVENRSRIDEPGLNLIVPECAIREESGDPTDAGSLTESGTLSIVVDGTPAADRARPSE